MRACVCGRMMLSGKVGRVSNDQGAAVLRRPTSMAPRASPALLPIAQLRRESCRSGGRKEVANQ